MLSVTIQGISSIAEPSGITDLVQRRYFSDELSGYLDEINGEVTIYGEGATQLRAMALNGLCGFVPVTIRDGCGLDIDANIYLNDAEWSLGNCSVQVQLVDAGFLSMVDNNMGIKAYLNVPKSKNGVDISARTNITSNITLQNTNGTITEPNRQGISYWDALDHLIAFMTDGQLGFVSDFFSAGEDAAVYSYLMTPIGLRDITTTAFALISFEELYTDLNKIFNIAFNVEYVAGVPRMRIEPKDYFRSTGTSYTFNDASDVRQTTDRDKIYAKVKFGSATFVPFGPVQSAIYPFAPFYNQKEEEYSIQGICNTKAVLDLKLNTLVTDMTVVLECLPATIGGQASTEYEDEVLVVQCDPSNFLLWTQPIPNLPNIVVLLNEGYMQRRIAERFIGYVPGSIYSWLGAGQDDSLAFSTAPFTLNPAASEPIVFLNTSSSPAFDPNGLMSQVIVSGFPATIYTVPSAGVYMVDYRLLFTSLNLGGIDMTILRRDSGGVTVETQSIVNFTNNILEGSFEFICDVGDTLMLLTNMFIGTIYAGSSFGVRSLYNQYYSGGEWKEYRIEDMDIMITQFKYPLPFQDWKQLIDNFNQKAIVTYNGGQQSGYPKDVTRNITTGESDITLMGRLLK